MEAQHQHFAMQGIQLHQRGGNPFPVLEVGEAIERASARRRQISKLMGRSSSLPPSNISSRLDMVRLRRWSMTRLRAMVNSHVSNRA